MIDQEKIAYLKQYRECGKEIQRLKDEIAQWRSLAEKVTPSFSFVPACTAGPGRIQTAVERIDALQHELFSEIVKLIDLRRAIGQAIDTVQDDRLCLLLRYRYIDGLTLEQAAEKMCYSQAQTARLHKAAIQKMMIWNDRQPT